MIELAIDYIQPIITHYGAMGVFLATLLEEIIAPIPSPLVPLTAGFFLLPAGETLVAVAPLAFITIALPVALGVSLGSLAVYGVGYWGGKPIIDRYGAWLGLSWADIERVEAKLTSGRGDEVVLLALRMVPVIPGVAISGCCGLVRYPVKTFVMITFFGSLVRAAALGTLGWSVGVVYLDYVEMISRFEKYVLLVVLLGVGVMAARWLMRRIHRAT